MSQPSVTFNRTALSCKSWLILVVISIAWTPSLCAGQEPTDEPKPKPSADKSTSEPTPVLPDLAKELRELGVTDQKHRMKLHAWMTKSSTEPPRPTDDEIQRLIQEQNTIDKANQNRLEEIIRTHGWPGKTMVGSEGAQTAFLIVQHAELDYQERYFAMIKKAAEQKEVSPGAVAMLEDRILMRKGKKQIYGSQLYSNETTQGKLVLHPIEDEAHVDERRASVGLPPLAEYLKLFGLSYEPPAEANAKPNAEPGEVK